MVPLNFTTNLKYCLSTLIVPFKKIVFNAINILNYLHILEHPQRCIIILVGKPSKRDLISDESDDYW